MPGVSIKDIARAAGVSHSTVSRALRGSALVSAPTRERITALARRMGYSPDAIARGLVTGRTRTVGVVVTTISDPFVADVVQGIEDRAQADGYSVILTTSDGEPAREMAAVDILRGKRVDAVIVTSSRVGALYLDDLERGQVPVVLVNSHNEHAGPYTFSITVDNQHGGWLATRHLADLGHRRIAYVTGSPHHSDDLGRQAGYRRALEEAGLTLDPALVLPGTGKAEAGAAALSRLLELPDRPTAVFCYNDVTAIGLLRAARYAGLSVPDDLAVIGFDDVPWATYVAPSLTTVAQPRHALGETAMNMALDLIGAEGAHGVGNVVVRGELVIRESCGGRSFPDLGPAAVRCDRFVS